jgi:ribosome-associated heat shock protein Hsp15
LEQNQDSIRIDKFLWAVRLYKTRSLASDAVDGGKVHLNDVRTKPAKIITVGDLIKIHRSPIYRTYKVIATLKNRVGAPQVVQYIQEVTPQSELDKLETSQMSEVVYYRPKGTGRPTKKDRRQLDEVWD